MMVWRPFYFANLDRRSDQPRPACSSRTCALIVSDRRRQELRRRPAAARTATGTTCGSTRQNPKHVIGGDDGGLWTSLRRRQPVVEERQPAGLAVLSRQRRRRATRTRSTAACRTTARGSATPRIRAASPTRAGRTSTAATASGRSPIRPTPTTVYAECAGRLHRARQPQDARVARHPAAGRLRGEAALQLEHADPRQPERRRARSTSARSSCSARATTGRRWERISPDLTTNDPREAEAGGVGRHHGRQLRRRRCTRRSTRSASRPRNADVIWVGTDDGNVQLTRDGGKTWTNVAGNVAGAAAGSLGVAGSRPAASTPATAYAAVRSAHLRRHDARTSSGRPTSARPGRASSDPSRACAATLTWSRRIRSSADLLFVGTEFGLWISNDRRRELGTVQAGQLPALSRCATSQVQARDHDLVLATHGRGIWIVDDITPLRALDRRGAAAGRGVRSGTSRPAADARRRRLGRRRRKIHR